MDNKQIKLSCAIIAKNEEVCIEKCLKSVQSADETVVADTGSTDNTVNIVRKYTDKIFCNYKWEDSMCKARNYVLSKCRGDWVLSIDCDEELEEGGIEKARKAIEEAEKKGFRTINIKLVDNSTEATHDFPRLFKRCKEVKWCGAIHNYLSVAEDFDADLKIYYGYSAAHAKDPDRTIRILKKEIENNPKLCREKFYLAREYWYRNDYQTAIKWYKEYFKVAWWSPERAEAWMMVAKCYQKLKQWDNARAACLQAIALNTNFKESLMVMASLSGPGNAKRWKEFARTASNESVLFVNQFRMVEVCLVVYKRLELLPQLIEDLKNQTTENFNLYIWNNSGQKLKVDFPEDRLQIFNCLENIGSMARFHLAQKVKDNVVVFIDDDMRLEPDFLEYYWDEHCRFGPKSILGWHTRKFKNMNYWDADRNAKRGDEVDYVGTGGMILSTDILKDKRLLNIPEQYNKVEDLYLSFIAKSKGYKLIKIEPHCDLVVDGKDQYEALWDYKQKALENLYADKSFR